MLWQILTAFKWCSSINADTSRRTGRGRAASTSILSILHDNTFICVLIDKRMEWDWKRSALGKKRRVAFSLT